LRFLPNVFDYRVSSVHHDSKKGVFKMYEDTKTVEVVEVEMPATPEGNVRGGERQLVLLDGETPNIKSMVPLDTTARRRKRAMPTRKKIQSNRLNALWSTGPRTREGKRIAALNALKHGLASSRLRKN
jgi:hypothetical protein